MWEVSERPGKEIEKSQVTQRYLEWKLFSIQLLFIQLRTESISLKSCVSCLGAEKRKLGSELLDRVPFVKRVARQTSLDLSSFN
jgi:hypothetical protein